MRKPSDVDVTSLLISGCELTPTQVDKLEQQLSADPDRLSARLKLLGYYFRHAYTSKRIAKKQLSCILWMIRNMPDNKALGMPFGEIHKEFQPAGYAKCEQLWQSQIAANSDNPAVITNAARFLAQDWKLAAKLYRQALAITPNDPAWWKDLAWRLRFGARKNSSRLRAALEAIQEALKRTREPYAKRYLYDDLAEIAFDMSEWRIAEKFARKSVSQASILRRDWYTGNAIHDGNCVLGRLALKAGQLKAARLHLRAASKTTGSPQLNSFGPNMRFAQEMLRAGETQAVISYLQECKRFWEDHTDELSECISKIEHGRRPKLPRVI